VESIILHDLDHIAADEPERNSQNRVISSSSSAEISCHAIIGICQPFSACYEERENRSRGRRGEYYKLMVTQCLSSASALVFMFIRIG
jgi:hypothetical protein